MLVADSLQENETPCILIFVSSEFAITAEIPNTLYPLYMAYHYERAKVREVWLVFFSVIKGM